MNEWMNGAIFWRMNERIYEGKREKQKALQIGRHLNFRAYSAWSSSSSSSSQCHYSLYADNVYNDIGPSSILSYSIEHLHWPAFRCMLRIVEIFNVRIQKVERAKSICSIQFTSQSEYIQQQLVPYVSAHLSTWSAGQAAAQMIDLCLLINIIEWME